MTAASASHEFITLGGPIASSKQRRYDHPYNYRKRALASSITPLEGKDQTKTVEWAVLLTAFAIDTEGTKVERKASRRKRPEAARAPVKTRCNARPRLK